MCPCVPDRIGIWKCWFLRRGENRSTWRKTSRSPGREPTTNLTHIWHQRRELNPGHIGGRQALLPLRHPCSPEDFACYAKKKITAFTATLEHSKNTKITTSQMTTTFQRIHVFARIYKHHFMSWNCQKTGKHFMKAGACFEIENIAVMNNKTIIGLGFCLPIIFMKNNKDLGGWYHICTLLNIHNSSYHTQSQ